MPRKSRVRVALGAVLALLAFGAGVAHGADISLPGVDIELAKGTGQREEVATAVRILLGLTVLSLAPALLLAVTSFTRIIIVLSMLRHGLGMQETPPNTVLVTLALFLTLFTMMPVFQEVNERAFQPYVAGTLAPDKAMEAAMAPLRGFMIRQTREQDLALMLEVSHTPAPESVEAISSVHLIPAFMLSELKSAFQIGFVIFLPFLLIDLVVSSVLMSMGMFMVPPVMISLPVKVLMFVLIDGWNLVVRSIVGSFH
ncbi:MAG: flagellar type III secretion system pore protein FliP [Burkholderiaceae bacterium]